MVPVRPICDALGLDWKSQHRKLTSNSERWCVVMMTTHDASGRAQEMVCLPQRRLFGWLMTIQPTKVKPEVREKLIAYQRHCDEVLYRHFILGDAAHPGLLAELERERRAGGEARSQVIALRQIVLAEKPFWSRLERYRRLGYDTALVADLVGRGAQELRRIVTMLENLGVLDRVPAGRCYDEPLPDEAALSRMVREVGHG
jgi:hypothetical protein